MTKTKGSKKTKLSPQSQLWQDISEVWAETALSQWGYGNIIIEPLLPVDATILAWCHHLHFVKLFFLLRAPFGQYGPVAAFELYLYTAVDSRPGPGGSRTTASCQSSLTLREARPLHTRPFRRRKEPHCSYPPFRAASLGMAIWIRSKRGLRRKLIKKGLKRRAGDDPESAFDIASVPATSGAYTSPMEVDDAICTPFSSALGRFFFLRLPYGQYGPVSQLSRSEESCTGPFNWGEAHCAGEKVKRKIGPFLRKSLWNQTRTRTQQQGRSPPRQPGTPWPGSQVHGPTRKQTPQARDFTNKS